MNYEIIDDITSADIAMRIVGSSLEDLFRTGAEALLSILLQDHGDISGVLKLEIYLENEQIDRLFYDFLQELIFFKDSESLLLVPDTIEIEETKKGYRLNCAASGEEIDRNKHVFNTDVKAVTMHNFQVTKENDVWVAIVVFDV